jgi:hypothetical protein
LRFLRRALPLPLPPVDLAHLCRFYNASLGRSYLIRTLFKTAQDINNLSDQTRILSMKIEKLMSTISRLTDPPRTKTGAGIGTTTSQLMIGQRGTSTQSSPHAYSVFSRETGEGINAAPKLEQLLPPLAGINPDPSTGSFSHFIDRGPKPTQRLPPAESPEKGICMRLAEQYGGNPAELGFISITGNSYDDGREQLLPMLVNYDWQKCWASRNEPNSWLLFDFTPATLLVTRYALKTYPLKRGFSHLRSWVLHGSIDGGTSWVELDRKEDCYDLNEKSKIAHFTVTTPVAVRAIKIIQIGVNHAGDNYLILTNVEFYGGVV